MPDEDGDGDVRAAVRSLSAPVPLMKVEIDDEQDAFEPKVNMTNNERVWSIVCHYSDGHEKHHPNGDLLNNSKRKNGPFTYNFYKKLDSTDKKTQFYEAKLGKLLVDQGICKNLSGRPFKLHSLPKGYALFNHYTRKPGVEIKIETYLFGHGRGRFDSPAEFFPHLVWLLTNFEHDSRDCECLICKTEMRVEPRFRPNRNKRNYETRAEAIYDRNQGKGLYRLGEVVWVRLKKLDWSQYRQWCPAVNRDWSPAVVISRPGLYIDPECPSKEEQARRSKEEYVLYAYPERLVSVTEPNIKPWIARPHTKLRVHQIREILRTYTTIGNAEIVTEGSEYSGIYLGPEKIWIGDVVWLTPSNFGPGTEEIMLLERILITEQSGIMFAGTLYRPGRTSPEDWPLPTKVTAEKSWAMALPPSQVMLVSVAEVIGRWYPSSVVSATHKRHSVVQRIFSRAEMLKLPLITHFEGM
ncbi:hypothetical protein V1512DRAFT_264615 [Lipomyces arxii]|uniref:uncharacterized protein n=1 Tax=Lipomyces arxii TaxID=56418 RepID=UPI0034CEAD8B